VALAEEGAALRAALGPGPAIYVFDGLMEGDARLVRDHALIPCLDSAEQIRRFAAELSGRACALQLDSGMNRLGLEPAELASVAELLAALRPGLVMSHLGCADEPAHPANAAQRASFAAAAAGVPGARRSLAATGGVLLGPAFHFDLTRPGVGLYGGLPFAAARPVVRLELPVIQVREVAPGESVGYGAAWTASRPSRIATLGAGYADGLIRALGGGGLGLWAGDVACPLVGRVSMDLVTADVTDLAAVPPALELLNARQGVDAVAAAAGTIGYEVLTSLGARFARVYHEGPTPAGPA
jgi:alanine racemase